MKVNTLEQNCAQLISAWHLNIGEFEKTKNNFQLSFFNLAMFQIELF